MQNRFYINGLLRVSNSGRSYRVYVLDDKGQRVFIGLVSKKALSSLLQNQISQADICKFSQDAAEESPSAFSVELGGTKQ
jgi:hypothetical protein